jgi:hypothetical protein
VAAVIGGAIFVATRLFPVNHPVRARAESAVEWMKRNPRLFEKRLKQVAFGLLVLVFLLLTLIYS